MYLLQWTAKFHANYPHVFWCWSVTCTCVHVYVVHVHVHCIARLHKVGNIGLESGTASYCCCEYMYMYTLQNGVTLAAVQHILQHYVFFRQFLNIV